MKVKKSSDPFFIVHHLFFGVVGNCIMTPLQNMGNPLTPAKYRRNMGVMNGTPIFWVGNIMNPAKTPQVWVNAS